MTCVIWIAQAVHPSMSRRVRRNKVFIGKGWSPWWVMTINWYEWLLEPRRDRPTDLYHHLQSAMTNVMTNTRMRFM